MQTLDQHQSASIVRLLNLGESKTGKTGALASLVRAGYHLWILDFDNGLDIVANTLRSSGDEKLLTNIHYETIRDQVIFKGGVPSIKSPPTAWKRVGEILNEWNISEFTDRDVLVMDTLTYASQAAFNQALFLGARLNQRPQLQDYGWMADSVKLMIEMLTDDSLKCHLIVNTHIRFLSNEADEAILKGLPNAKGQEVSRTIATYFNTVVLTRSVGSGPATKREISTKPQGVVEVATSNPKNVKPSYSIESGLAELFADILGKSPKQEK